MLPQDIVVNVLVMLLTIMQSNSLMPPDIVNNLLKSVNPNGLAPVRKLGRHCHS